ncbi:MAG: LysM peptidoglycan-binding domain-containing protein [bacterium]
MNSESTIRLLAVFGIVIGLAGVGAGGTAIYYQVKGKEAAVQVDARLADIEQKLSMLPSEISRVEKDLRGQVQNQIRNVAQMQDGSLNAVRLEVSELRDQLTALTNKPAPVEPPAQTPDTGMEEQPSGPGGTYVIQSGDTYGKIARKQGATISAIQDANPGVDPSRLKIGQTIQLP